MEVKMKDKCFVCNGLGYLTDVISYGLSDPDDPYHYPHTERCDTCMVFDSDKAAEIEEMFYGKS